MPVYMCPDASHKDKPVPLAEDSEGLFVCMASHKYSTAKIPGQGRILCDEESNVMYDIEYFDLSLLQYQGDEKVETRDLRVQLPEGSPGPETKEDGIAEARDPTPEAPLLPEKPKKVRRISTNSVLAIVDGVDFNNLSLNPQEWKVFAKIDGLANVSDVVAASKLDEKTAFSLLAGLIKRGLVEVRS